MRERGTVRRLPARGLCRLVITSTLVTSSFLLNAQTALPYLAVLPAGEVLVKAAALPDGRLVVASHRREMLEEPTLEAGVLRDWSILRLISANGELQGRMQWGGTRQVLIADVAVQANGRIIVVGRTNSESFRVVEPLFPQVSVSGGPSGTTQSQGFVALIAADLSRVLRSTLIGGAMWRQFPATDAALVAVDGNDRIYVTGGTTHLDLPVAGEGRTLPPAPDGGNSSGPFAGPEAYVMGFDRDLANLDFSGRLGILPSPCVGASSCFSRVIASSVRRLHATGDGQLTLLTTGTSFARTEGALDLTGNYGLAPQSVGGTRYHLLRIHARSATLDWQADVGFLDPRAGGPQPVGRPFRPPQLAVDDSETSYVAMLNDWVDDAQAADRPLTIDVIRISPDGRTLLQRDALASDSNASLDAFLLDADGAYWLAGPAGYPLWEPAPPESHSGSQYVLRFDPQLRKTTRYALLPHGNANLQLLAAPVGGLWAVSEAGVLQGIERQQPVQRAVLGTANLAAYKTSGQLSPGEMAALYGIGFGPSTGQVAVLDANHRLPRSLNGIEVLINGIASPLFYAGGEQVNLIVPFGAQAARTDGSLMVELRYHGEARMHATLRATDAQPHVFSLVRSWNSGGAERTEPFAIIDIYGRPPELQLEPLRPGDVFTLWMNGSGVWREAVEDGEIAQPPYNEPLRRLRATLLDQYGGAITGSEFLVEYFGAAPGFAAGLIQLNLRIPATLNVPPGEFLPIQLSVGEDQDGGFRETAVAPKVWVAIRP